jgi:hypothetical protein
MKRVRFFMVLVFLLAVATLMLGWAAVQACAAVEEKPAAAAAAKEGENGGKEAAKEEAKEDKGEAKEDECPPTFGPIITDTAVPIDKGKFAIQPTYGFSFITKTFNKDWRSVSTGGSFRTFTMDYKITLGLWDNLEGFVVIPFQANWANNMVESGPKGERSGSHGGLADINATLKYRFVKEELGTWKPTVTALFSTDFPTGRFRNLNPSLLGIDALGGGAYVFTTGLNTSKCVKGARAPWVFYGNLWYSMQTAYTGDDQLRVFPRDFVTVNLAMERVLSKDNKWVGLLELTSFWDAGRLFGHKANTPPGALLSILPGIEYMATDRLSFALGVNIDLAGKNTDAAVTPVLSFVVAF